jgi:hypothetical protein
MMPPTDQEAARGLAADEWLFRPGRNLSDPAAASPHDTRSGFVIYFVPSIRGKDRS